MNQLISFDIKAEFGFLKKPDTNEPMYLTFNMIHKPFVLGLLGAILGKKGFEENNVLPEYYRELQHIQIGIAPINSEKGNFPKTVIKYNNSTGAANATSIENIKGKIGATLNIVEQTLVNPSYRIYLLTDNQELITRIKNQEAIFLPYLGKNDFSLWWDKVKNYNYQIFNPDNSYKVCSLFTKKMILKEGKQIDEEVPVWEMDFSGEEFIYFERLPTGYDEDLYQYIYKPFVYTTFKLNKDYKIDNLYQLDNGEVIQLF
ncbi:MAG: hypothetical protein PETM_02693 [Petrimonas sp.]|jgi:CRISPR-associated protein Cas5h|uniref:type I-B CRISPR-associated protein Cas5b n=1 Tax=Petrimonas sp. TaxID=2023866 RepID=UPI002A43A70C|nr:type I-B CRISPR-associated protein Cas5b [Bacteroidales bacterium]MDD3939621.1 type I-B CRISPR-associated protein Cas5b [Patescibacteria group bacterium]